MNLGLLHPGEMGVTVGAALVESGHAVHWLAAGRSADTGARARSSGFRSHGSLSALLEQATGVVSVCPPHAAVEVASAVAAEGFPGVYVDANAVAPATAREIARIVGANYVDGGIVGPPARSRGTTRLYLSGPGAGDVAAWFSQGFVEAVVLGEGLAEASALKMCYAAYTKGSSALLLAIRALAEHEGVTDGLLAEWARSQPGLPERSQRAATGTAPKAWRFVGEMREIASAFADAGLPDGFHAAAGEIYSRIGDLKDADRPGLKEVLRALDT
ncbi:MAG: DUF1932 domain-containing protein [Gammaproteobacteria bacterium]|nr:DUF1932 domain-containing protein [Gammaproteobacteria bacterium]